MHTGIRRKIPLHLSRDSKNLKLLTFRIFCFLIKWRESVKGSVEPKTGPPCFYRATDTYSVSKPVERKGEWFVLNTYGLFTWIEGGSS